MHKIHKTYFHAITGTLFTLAVHAIFPSAPAVAEKPLLRFVQWNDVHLDVNNKDYRLVNEKMDYLVSSLNAQERFPVPDFVVGVGDMITGEGEGIPKLAADFKLLKEKLAKLKCPFYPVMGNHENIQGEGNPQLEAPYREAFGAERVNYTFEAAGIQFVMLNDSGAPMSNDTPAGKARRDWLRDVFEKSPETPKIICAHVPLAPVRDPQVLAESFHWGSETTKDKEMLKIVTDHADKVIAVLSGHLHLTGVAKFHGIYQIVVSGTASYPCDYAYYEVFEDRIHVQIHTLPEHLITPDTDNYAPPIRPKAYTDPDHKTHYAYLAGNPSERSFDISLKRFGELKINNTNPKR